MTTLTAKTHTIRPSTAVINSENTLEGGGFDERHPWRSPLRGALRASNSAPGRIVPCVDRALHARLLTGNPT
ncbi:MAG: hypothetical protein Tsb0026_06820 [Sulfuricaulis sp.]